MSGSGDLGAVTFTGNGTADSPAYAPRAGNIRFVLVGTPTQVGTCRVFMYSVDSANGAADAEAQGTAAVAGNANVPNCFPIEGAFAGSGVRFFLRYTNTNNTPGSVRFRFGEEV